MADFSYPSDDELDDLIAELRSSGDPELANITRRDIWFCTPLTPFHPEVTQKYLMTYHPERFAGTICPICGFSAEEDEYTIERPEPASA